MTKVDKNLVIEIPKKYKKQLISRFSPSNLHDGVTKVECPLCKDFRVSCNKCPFGKYLIWYMRKFKYYDVFSALGCMNWMYTINPAIKNIFNFADDYVRVIKKYEDKTSFAKKVLKEFKEKALKHIVWS